MIIYEKQKPPLGRFKSEVILDWNIHTARNRQERFPLLVPTKLWWVSFF